MAEVVLADVTKAFGATTALDAVSLTVPNGAFVVLLGPTGAGKTTTLRLISGLDRPDAGEIFIGGRPMAGRTPAQRNVAMVFQQYSLYPHMTVRENLAFPLRSPLLATPPRRDRPQGQAESPRSCRSPTSSTTRRPRSRAARCSASRSAGRWSATPRST